jgi:A/G-specific adenine glycosylase
MNKKQISQFQKRILRWFNINQRKLPWRATKNPYHIWVAEVMLQQTQVKKVLEYYQKFIDQFPDVQSLAKADLQQVLKAWEGMGYYARARSLHKAAQLILKEKGGIIPKTYHDFKKMPGAGEYITAAVLSQAFNALHTVVDGNVKRVLSRVFLIDKPVNLSSSRTIFKEQADLLLDQSEPGDFNQAIMELGAIICRPKNPKCHDCPITSFCGSFKMNQQSKYPLSVKSKSIPEYHIAVGIIHKNGHILIIQRQPDGLLGGLWEFPGGRVKQGENSEQVCIRKVKEKMNLDVKVTGFLTRISHAYTHFKIIMDVFDCGFQSGKVTLNGPADFRWIAVTEVDHFPFHAANHKFIPLLKEKLTIQ